MIYCVKKINTMHVYSIRMTSWLTRNYFKSHILAKRRVQIHRMKIRRNASEVQRTHFLRALSHDARFCRSSSLIRSVSLTEQSS